MLWTAALLIGLVACVNRRLHGDYCHPACQFTGLWSLLLGGLAISGDAFNNISDETLVIYVLGAIALSIGASALSTLSPPPPIQPTSVQEVRLVGRFVEAGAALLVLLIPAYWHTLTAIAERNPHRHMLAAVRDSMVSGQSQAFGLFTYALPAAMLLSLIAAAIGDGSNRGKMRTISTVGLTLGYYALTGSRYGTILTLAGVAAIGWMRVGRLRLRTAMLTSATLVAFFSIAAFYRNDLGIAATTGSIAGSLRLYVFGGLVAFDRTVTGTDAPVYSSYVWRPFYKVVEASGYSVDVPPQVLPFTRVPEPTNVYTIYYAYYTAFGWLGTILAMFALGAVLAWLYRRARAGSRPCLALYGLASGFILVSNANEGFLSSISFWAYATLFVTLVFGLARLRSRATWIKHPSLLATLPYGRTQ